MCASHNTYVKHTYEIKTASVQGEVGSLTEDEVQRLI